MVYTINLNFIRFIAQHLFSCQCFKYNNKKKKFNIKNLSFRYKPISNYFFDN